MEFPSPRRNVDPYSLSNDEFGYSVYTMILFASQRQQDAVNEIRDAVKVRRSMLAAHVTVKGPICLIPSASAVQTAIDKVAEGIQPMNVLFEGKSTVRTIQNGEVVASQPIKLTPEIVDLHDRLLSMLDDMSTTAYSLETRGLFHPHLTIYHEPEPDLEPLGEKLLAELDMGPGFEADRISLMGHSGRPFRGEWSPISDHRLAAGD